MQAEGEDIQKVLTLGLPLNPSLPTCVEDNHRKTFGHFDVTNFPVNPATLSIFALDCMWASFHVSQIVEI